MNLGLGSVIPVVVIVVAIVAIAGYVALTTGPTTTELSSSTTVNCSSLQCSTSSTGSTSEVKCVTTPCVQGSVNVGPLCPVEYAGTTVISGTTTTTLGCGTNMVSSVNYSQYDLVFSENGGSMISDTVYLDSGGYFAIDLPADTYTVTMPNCQWMGCSQVFPNSVTVLANQITYLNITIDTGIR